MHKTGCPVLVGTTSVEQSDSLSEQLREAGIPHEVKSLVFMEIFKNVIAMFFQMKHGLK